MNYRRMEVAALLVFTVCAAGLGVATALFDLTDTQALVLFILYLIGGLPAILYLHFIAQAQRESSRTTDRSKAISMAYVLWVPLVAIWIVAAVRADDPVTRWLFAGAAALAVIALATGWWQHRRMNARRTEGASDS